MPNKCNPFNFTVNLVLSILGSLNVILTSLRSGVGTFDFSCPIFASNHGKCERELSKLGSTHEKAQGKGVNVFVMVHSTTPFGGKSLILAP